jgi:hypothetical protein
MGIPAFLRRRATACQVRNHSPGAGVSVADAVTCLHGAAPWKPPSASVCRTGTMPLVSCRFADETSIAGGMPHLSAATWILTPRIFFQRFVYEIVDIGKCVPWARRCLCGTDGGSHVLASML